MNTELNIQRMKNLSNSEGWPFLALILSFALCNSLLGLKLSSFRVKFKLRLGGTELLPAHREIISPFGGNQTINPKHKVTYGYRRVHVSSQNGTKLLW